MAHVMNANMSESRFLQQGVPDTPTDILRIEWRSFFVNEDPRRNIASSFLRLGSLEKSGELPNRTPSVFLQVSLAPLLPGASAVPSGLLTPDGLDANRPLDQVSIKGLAREGD